MSSNYIRTVLDYVNERFKLLNYKTLRNNLAIHVFVISDFEVNTPLTKQINMYINKISINSPVIYVYSIGQLRPIPVL